MGLPRRLGQPLVLVAAASLLSLVHLQVTVSLQSKRSAGADWPMYNRDLGGTRFSPLKQITPKNVSNLKLAWQFKLRPDTSGPPASGLGPFSQATPIVVEGVMYLPAGNRILALDPDSGKILWTYNMTGGTPTRRGVAYWPGAGTIPARIYFTAGRRLIGLNSDSGEKVAEIDMVIPYNSVPTIYKNLLIVGANVPERQGSAQPGNTRAFDAITGKKVWEFHSVPQPGEVGNDSWSGDSWKDRTGVNNWGFYMTLDTERGLLYTVFGSPASDYYGGDREGNNLFGNSVVALEAETGKLKWYFQTVHHDQWDFDLPPAPVLLDVTIKGQEGSAPRADRQGRLFVRSESCHGRTDIRNRREARTHQQGSRRTQLADATHSRETEASWKNELYHGRSRHSAGHHRGTRESLPRAG